MKTFNLDKFANKRTVEFHGKTYTINGLTLEDEINGNISERIMNAESVKDRLLALKDFVLAATTFTEDEVKKMNLDLLFALFKISQGIDPDKEDEAQGNENKE